MLQRRRLLSANWQRVVATLSFTRAWLAEAPGKEGRGCRRGRPSRSCRQRRRRTAAPPLPLRARWLLGGDGQGMTVSRWHPLASWSGVRAAGGGGAQTAHGRGGGGGQEGGEGVPQCCSCCSHLASPNSTYSKQVHYSFTVLCMITCTIKVGPRSLVQCTDITKKQAVHATSRQRTRGVCFTRRLPTGQASQQVPAPSTRARGNQWCMPA
jgi:hypothetical protein